MKLCIKCNEEKPNQLLNTWKKQMDEHHFELWANQVRRDDKIWNKGFRWGCFSGFLLMWVFAVFIGWLVAPGY